jgi:enoyl-CoA hydratase/carnithine racemase
VSARVRVVVFASSHETVFSSGAQSWWLRDVPLVHKHLGSERSVSLFRLIGALGKPTL